MWPPDPDLPLVHAAGFIYLPVQFDPAVAREVGAPGAVEPPETPLPEAAPSLLLVSHGRHYVRAFRPQTFLNVYHLLFPQDYERSREVFWRGRGYAAPPTGRVVSRKLATIIFDILPYFIRTKTRGRPGQGSTATLWERIGTQMRRSGRGRSGNDPTETAGWDRLGRDGPEEGRTELPEGHLTGGQFRVWLEQALGHNLQARERERLAREVREQEEMVAAAGGQAAVLRHLAARRALEIDGVGFERLGEKDDYLIYRRTGVYGLRDSFGRVYLFPDGRVAVSTRGPLHPVVWEKYKHPLLLRHARRQQICIKDFQAPGEFSAGGVITALEQGLNALYYGYNYRKRNGYHSLDRMGRDLGGVSFDDYKVAKDHPLLVGGQVEVTNDFI